MFDDSDIKIVGNKPSESIIKNEGSQNFEAVPAEVVEKSKKLGCNIAEKFLEESKSFAVDDNGDTQMLLQRKLLLSFTVTVGLESYCKNDTISGIAQKSFLDNIRKNSFELYTTCSDTGAFSFYYLAYRRQSEVERRIGQTFAMLCSHDGDPIYQELGETLYCWFLSVVRVETEKLNLN